MPEDIGNSEICHEGNLDLPTSHTFLDYSDEGHKVGRVKEKQQRDWVLLVATLFLCLPTREAACHEPLTRMVTYQHLQQQQTVVGEVLREFGDGSLLLLVSDGRLLTLHSDEIVETHPSDQPLAIDTYDQVIEGLRPTLGDGFQFRQSKHYLIAYNTNPAYAEWVGQLFERLYRGFYNYWKARSVVLQEPRFPLVAIVFSNKASYLAYGQRDIGDAAGSMLGYYNMNTNRMVMYDLTGVDGAVPAGQRVSTHILINQILSQPQSERTVATIVHEAVHQLAYNSGLQVRLADNPLWLSEGLAMYFESPDLRSPQGWKMGNTNQHNLLLFTQYCGRRTGDSLVALIRDDERFKSVQSVADAYPESWALAYFLMKARGKQFGEYLKEIGKLEPLGESDVEKRTELFIQHFGDLQKLDRDFLSYMKRVR